MTNVPSAMVDKRVGCRLSRGRCPLCLAQTAYTGYGSSLLVNGTFAANAHETWKAVIHLPAVHWTQAPLVSSAAQFLLSALQY